MQQTENALSLTKRVDMYKVPSSKLRVQEGLNIRTDYGNITELVESIRENGVKVPLRGFKDKDGYFVVVDGHRRYKACQILLEEGIEVNVPFILEAKGYSEEQRLIDMFIMNEGKSLTVLEKAEGVRRFIAYGYSEKEIGKKLAYSEGYVRKLNSLNHAPKAFIKLIEQGTISGTLAIDIAAKGTEAINEVITKASGSIVPEDSTTEQRTGTDGSEITDNVTTGGEQKKITKKDLQKQNSLALFKQVTKEIDTEATTLSHDQELVYEFVWKLINNNLSEKDLKEFFQ